MTDECTQDWTLVSAEVDADSLVFVAERALDTGDTQDRVFVDDSADGEFVLFSRKENMNKDACYKRVVSVGLKTFLTGGALVEGR